MVTLSAQQKAAVAKSIRAQYEAAGTRFVPPVVARARALRLVLQKGPESRMNRLAKDLKKALRRRAAEKARK